MPGFLSHKCPKCDTEMVKEEDEIEQSVRHKKVWDLGLTGSGVTTSTTTSGSGYRNVTVTLPPECLSPRSIKLIPYRCPKCGHRESFRE